MVKLIGVIRKPSDVNEWPFWTGAVTRLDGTKITVNVGTHSRLKASVLRL